VTHSQKTPIKPVAECLSKRRGRDLPAHAVPQVQAQSKRNITVKTLKLTFAAIALAALPLSIYAAHEQTKECKACCKTADKCDACCKDRGKECGKDCCKPK
jgi:hypothetical protein